MLTGGSPSEVSLWVLSEAKYVGEPIQWIRDADPVTNQHLGKEYHALHDWVLLVKMDSHVPPWVDPRRGRASNLPATRFKGMVHAETRGGWLQLDGNVIYVMHPAPAGHGVPDSLGLPWASWRPTDMYIRRNRSPRCSTNTPSPRRPPAASRAMLRPTGPTAT